MFRDEPYSRVFHGLSRIPGISRHVTMPYSMVNFQLKGSVIKPLSVNKISKICCVALQLQLCPINQMKQVLLRNIPVTWKEADNILWTMCDGKSSFTTFHFGVTKVPSLKKLLLSEDGLAFSLLQWSTIPDKIFGTKWNNPVKLDRRRKVWYLFLRVF